MDIDGKKIWVDVEEPKTGIMFKSLIERFQNAGSKVLVTARDYDSTFQVMDDTGIEYIKVGRHGGERLDDKLDSYIDRLKKLLPIIKEFAPDYFVTFSSVEGTRIAYGLQIGSIGFNDEPRNEPVCKLILPYLDYIITPKCIPKELYIKLHADPKKLIRYNGIDEIGWLSEYVPNPEVLSKFDLTKGEYVLMRTEPSFASYFIDSRFEHQKLDPNKTSISLFFPAIYKEFPNHKYFLIVRTDKQEAYLKSKLKTYQDDKNVIITRYLPNIVDLCFFGGLIISGGGTIVRESSLLNVPSIESFPGDSAPQELFLIENGFPLYHIRDPKEIAAKSIQILNKGASLGRFNQSFMKKIREFENPNSICFNKVLEQLEN
jgi:predicted glycosyltransferase